ncbi:MAG: hypothetical protein V1799_07460 [bacterium]
MEQKPNDLIPINGWVFELPGLTSPHFHKLSGIGVKTGTMTIIDGGTNMAFNFSDGIEENGAITMTRTRDNSAADGVFAKFVRDVIKTGVKVNGSFVQYRHGKQVLKILFTGLLMNDFKYNDFDTSGKGDGAKSDQTYVAQVDHWEEA